MEPTYKEGDWLFASRLFYHLFKPKLGDVVVLDHPFRRILIVKRIKKITPAGIYVAGDNPLESEDSASFGPLSRASLIAKVIFSY